MHLRVLVLNYQLLFYCFQVRTIRSASNVEQTLPRTGGEVTAFQTSVVLLNNRNNTDPEVASGGEIKLVVDDFLLYELFLSVYSFFV